MGFGGIGIWQLLIILIIVLLLFGTKRLRNLGGDLGSMIKGFKGAMREGEEEPKPAAKLSSDQDGDLAQGVGDKDKEKV